MCDIIPSPHTINPCRPSLSPAPTPQASGVGEGRLANVVSGESDAFFETADSAAGEPLPWIEVRGRGRLGGGNYNASSSRKGRAGCSERGGGAAGAGRSLKACTPVHNRAECGKGCVLWRTECEHDRTGEAA